MDREVDWMRSQATDSQIEGILNQRNDLISKVEILQRKIELAAKTFELMSDLMLEYTGTLRNQNNIFNNPIDNIK